MTAGPNQAREPRCDVAAPNYLATRAGWRRWLRRSACFTLGSLLISLPFSAVAAVASMMGPGVVTPLMTKTLAAFPGKEALMITVTYPPGGADPVHRHNAYAFVYVLEGAVVMQVRGQHALTLGPGQTFFEAPGDVHAVARNASTTQPAKFLVLLIKDKGAPVVLPAK